MPAATERFSVVVAGAGPVGLAVAAALASGPHARAIDVQIVDVGNRPEWRPTTMDSRVYALSRASQRLFERLGLWRWLVERRVSVYRKMRVWRGADSAGAASIEFDCADIGEPDLGHIVEDSLIKEALLGQLDERANVRIYFDTAVSALTYSGDRLRVALTDGRVLSCSLLIAADGVDSGVRELAGITAVRRRYRQHAIVTDVQTTVPHAQTAWQRFLPGGPLAFLPLADGRSSIVWSMPDDNAQQLARAADADFLDALQHASAGVLGSLGDPMPRISFPLLAQHAFDYCKQRVVLIGDAAHAVHPLAGQGMNLGLLDASCLAQIIETALSERDDPGDRRVLRRYERARKGANLSMLVAFDCFDRFFRAPDWLAPLQDSGLWALDHAAVVKQNLMRRALGVSAV